MPKKGRGYIRSIQNAIRRVTVPIYIGRPPVFIEILIKVKGLRFDDTYNASFDYEDKELKV